MILRKSFSIAHWIGGRSLPVKPANIEERDAIATEGLVEVRTPTYRRPVLLRRALESLIGQSYPHWRCIVLDDEPGGGVAREVCVALRDERIVYRANARNLGVGGNIDQAFALEPLPGSRYACVLEDDNYYLPDCLSANLAVMRAADTDIILRNQFIEVPAGRDRNGSVGPRTTYDGQYIEGVLTKDELWGSFFYSTAANNSSIFWRLERGLSFSTTDFTADPVFQERLRTLCIDRDVCIAMEPQIVWRDNGAESLRPRSGEGINFMISQVKAVALERRLYKTLFRYFQARGKLDHILHPRQRNFDARCERVFARCGIRLPRPSLLSPTDRLRLRLLRLVAMSVGLFVAEPVKYRLCNARIQPKVSQ